MRARQTYSCVQLHLLFKRWENLLWFVIDLSDFSIVCFLVSIDRILTHCWASVSFNQIHVLTDSRIVYLINEGMSGLVLCSTVFVKWLVLVRGCYSVLFQFFHSVELSLLENSTLIEWAYGDVFQCTTTRFLFIELFSYWLLQSTSFLNHLQSLTDLRTAHRVHEGTAVHYRVWLPLLFIRRESL